MLPSDPPVPRAPDPRAGHFANNENFPHVFSCASSAPDKESLELISVKL